MKVRGIQTEEGKGVLYVGRGGAMNGVEGMEANTKQGGSVELVKVWRVT